MADRRVGRGVLCTEALVEDDAMVKADVVEAVLARLAAGESVAAVAAAFDLDRKTVRAWRTRGGYRPRAPRERATLLAAHAAWLTARAPELAFNSVVLTRELRQHHQYRGTEQTVLRFIRPLRLAAQRPAATVRFETAPGQQAQVDFGQRRVWIGERAVVAHVFVCTLGFSRRVYVEAFPHERLDAVLAGPMRTSPPSTASRRGPTGRTARRPKGRRSRGSSTCSAIRWPAGASPRGTS